MGSEREVKMRTAFEGALLGLAVGDALGTTLEFCPPGSFEPIADMVGGGPFLLKIGQWTDDTSMALCLAESLHECRGFDPADQMSRYVRWWREGHLSCTGQCFDVGTTTRAALARFERTGEPYCGTDDPTMAGNGSLMRLAPVAMQYCDSPEDAIRYAGLSSRTTHGAATCVDACRYLCMLIIGAIRGKDKGELLSRRFTLIDNYWDGHPLAAEIDEVACGSFKQKNPPEIRAAGHVVKTLEAALWAFHRTDSFEQGCLMAVNLGDDADTVGAVYGQLAGSYYGTQGIPEKWLARLAMKDLIECKIEGLRWQTHCRF